jgi:hypothetical protein
VQHPSRPQLVRLLSLLASDTFAMCVLCATAATALLAFGCGAEAHLVIGLLLLGVVTAFVETSLRAGKDK